MEPLVSILIPAYNVEELLGDTLKSVQAQTWQNLEVIVINDGSSDDTSAVAKSFESNKIKVIDQENRGQSATENRAIRESQGDFLIFLDADDMLSPEKVELQVKLLESPDSRFVAACEWARFFHDTSEAEFVPEQVWKDLDPVDWLVTSWMGGGMMHGAAWLIPRKIAEAAGPWNEELSLINDFDYFPRILLASDGVKFCWGARTYYRNFDLEDAPNLSGARSRSAVESALKALKLGTGALIAAEDSERTRLACATAIQRFVYSTYPSHADLVNEAEQLVTGFGGTSLEAPGGPKFKLLESFLGWRLTTRIQKALRGF